MEDLKKGRKEEMEGLRGKRRRDGMAGETERKGNGSLRMLVVLVVVVVVVVVVVCYR